MTLSPRKRTQRQPAVRRTGQWRKYQTAAAGTMPRKSIFVDLWVTQRARIFAIGMMLILVVALLFFFNTDYFYVFNFNIAGARNLTTAEIEKASGVVGYSTFFIDSHSVERALMKLPEVKSVHVRTQLPNQMHIEIEERKPELAWLRGNETYWVASDGVVMKARKNMPEFSTIRDLDQSRLQLGQRAPVDALTAFLALRAAYPEGPRAVEWSNLRGMAYTDEHGWKIILGNADEMDGKIAKLRVLVPQLVAKKASIKYIDLGRGDPYYQ